MSSDTVARGEAEFRVLRFSRVLATWRVSLIFRSRYEDAARAEAHNEFLRCAQAGIACAVAIVPQDGEWVEFRVYGFVPLDIEERIWQAVDRKAGHGGRGTGDAQAPGSVLERASMEVPWSVAGASGASPPEPTRREAEPGTIVFPSAPVSGRTVEGLAAVVQQQLSAAAIDALDHLAAVMIARARADFHAIVEAAGKGGGVEA
jgi:hypothetical protein